MFIDENHRIEIEEAKIDQVREEYLKHKSSSDWWPFDFN